MAVTKRYCIDDAVVNYKPAELLNIDNVRTTVYNHIFDGIDLKQMVCKMRDLRKIGKDADCEIDTLFYLQMLAEYFVIINEELSCGNATTYEDLVTDYKLECIRNILTCSYGLGNLIEDLTTLLGLNLPTEGIGYMTVSLDECEPFIVN